MRELKFRGWSNYSKTMKYFDRPEDMRCLVVMQSTGAKDKNGKEIFEGDIVMFNNNSYIIIYNKYSVSFVFSEGFFLSEVSSFYIDETEVVGNIFENQDMLEKKFGITIEKALENIRKITESN